MRLRICAIVVTFGVVAANAAAQSRDPLPSWSVSPRTGSAADGWPNDPLPLLGVSPLGGRTGVPLPEIGLPLPPIGLRPPAGRPHSSRSRWPRRFTPWPYMIVVIPEPALQATASVAAQPPSPVITAKGSLVLDVQPATAQVFVDGFYAGTADDFSGRRGGAFLETGPHAIDLFDQAFEPVRFDVKIAPNESVAYRRELTPLEQKPAPSAAPIVTTPTTIYMIPGCYVGNVPPKDAALPASCDLTQTQVFKM